MPIKLNDLSNLQTPANVYNAKFFGKSLTGTGGKSGVLGMAANPVNTGAKVKLTPDAIDPVRRSFKNGKTTTSYYPLSVITKEIADLVGAYPEIPDKTVEFARSKRYPEVALRIAAEPTALVLQVTESGQGDARVTERKLLTCYMFAVFRTNDNTGYTAGGRFCANIGSMFDGGTFPVAAVDMTANLPRSISQAVSETLLSNDFDIDQDTLDKWLGSYSLYDHVCYMSEMWQEHSNEAATFTVSSLISNQSLGDKQFNAAYRMLGRLEFYKVPLDMYLSIYDAMAKRLDQQTLTSLCKANLNLMLSDTMNSLKSQTATLNRVVPQPGTQPKADSFYSQDQAKAIESADPLVLIQSGAGSGKSSTIKGRLKYMTDCGIDPNDIMVLSFTNAAADHILEIAPHVHSMTIAKMIHAIYEANFPNHTLSSEDTLINSLDIYFPNDPFAMNFKRVLAAVAKDGDPSAATRLNAFVENHYDEVMKCLDVTQQTTLNLEIVICHQKIDVLSEPPNIRSQHLIVDEVQDNSIFEFVYILRYVAKHAESLYIVGDASQTLYEFRASNPRALNVMEASGIFSTYKLQVNYRSNQEILEFANLVLCNIEANRYAQIRLRANSLAKVTSASFQDRVRFVHFHLAKYTDMGTTMNAHFVNVVKPYVDERLALGQKVCFLAYRRANVSMFQELVKKYYPNVPTASLVPERSYNSVVFSTFIKKYWNEIRFAPHGSIVVAITSEIVNRLDTLIGAKRAVSALPSVQKMILEWRDEIRPKIQLWEGQVNAGTITRDEMLERVKEDMLDFEIRQNTARQAVLSAQNARAKENDEVKNARILFSTIHSVKGLEFDNTVVLYRAENNLEEDAKRMYYVAFTRAMRSELILSYSKLVNPTLRADYLGLIEDLVAQETNAAMGTAVNDA